MDILNSLFDSKKTFQRTRIPVPQVTSCKTKNDSDEEMETDEEENYEKSSTNYVEEYKRLELMKNKETVQIQEKVNCLETNTNDTLAHDFNVCNEIYSQPIFDVRLRTQPLGIDMYKTSILSLIRTNQVVVIEGPTGCGKSTQVPQFILDDCRDNFEYCNIVVTQPRRIATISLARRVCSERGWTLGDVCGYQVGLEKNVTANTLLSYVTTGVLLNKLIAKKDALEYTHIIVDEIHERGEDMDFLLVLLRKFLYTHYLNVKIVLMSATLDTHKFSEYFRNNLSMGMELNAPALCITQESKFRVQVFYIEQLKSLGKIPDYNINEPKIDPCLYENLVLLIIAFDTLDEGSEYFGSVLVFLPGILEIEEAYKHLSSSTLRKLAKWKILPLHSSVATDEQRAAFSTPEIGERKIILSTNIAESSITVNDIVYVVDFCLTKQMVVDMDTQCPGLKLHWASHNNCTQRAGRVGRVCDGRVYRFVPRDFYQHEMQKDSVPEILRCPLDRVVLYAKLLELNEPPEAILALLLDPPNLGNIESTIWKLKEAGAMLLTRDGVKMVSDGDLTIIGRIMASLPFDIHLSKLIVLGYVFNCLEDCIIMAAGLSLHNIFTLPFQAHLKSYTNKLTWADGSCSDLITYLNLYKVWREHVRSNNFANGYEIQWAKNNFLNLRCLREWAILVTETTNRLKWLGVADTSRRLEDTDKPLVLKVVIAGAFYPNYFVRSKDGDQIDEREAVKEVGGRDPFTTVYFKCPEMNHPGILYARRIKDMLSDIANNMQVQFDGSKIFVHFIRYGNNDRVNMFGREYVSSIPGKIAIEVYRAVRRRQLRIQTRLPVLSVDEGLRRVQIFTALNANNPVDRQCTISDQDCDGPVLPDCDVEYIKIQITHRIDVGHFWAQNCDDQTTNNLYYIQRELNRNPLGAVRGRVDIEELYAAPFDEDQLYYRCRVVSISYCGDNNLQAQIIFIDYGNTDSIPLNYLRELPDGLVRTKPPQAIECVLSNIKPSLLMNPQGVWHSKVNKKFRETTTNCDVYGKVYSVVDGVVHLELYKEIPQRSYGMASVANSLNQWLIDNEYAVYAEESYLSKMNHERRIQIQTNDFTLDNRKTMKVSEELAKTNVPDMKPPPMEECRHFVNLRGPYSPLEMRVYSCANYARGKEIAIDGQSVNVALLDSNPEDSHDRLIVAGYVHQNRESSSFSLKNTTIMPNIPGFPVLMSALFCPSMQTKLSDDGTFIASLLFGLGTFADTDKSVYPAHDMSTVLDVKLEMEDLVHINELRYLMNLSISIMESIYHNQTPSEDPGRCQSNITKQLFKILKKKRETQPKTSVKYAEMWNKFKYKGNILYPTNKQAFDRCVWPLHWTMQLNKTQDKEIKNHLTMLRDMATKTIPMTEITCKLCNVTIRNIQDMRIHLNSEIHLNEVQKI